jgi:hypothetical protein
MTTPPPNRRPQSEIYRDVAIRWADLDAAARMLEETKTAVLSQKMAALTGLAPAMSVSRAEQQVKASPEWSDFLDKMVRARTQANKAKIEVEFTRMQFWERNSADATERQEMRMTT